MNVKTLIQCKPIECTVNNINLSKGNAETKKKVLPYPRMETVYVLNNIEEPSLHNFSGESKLS